jgi:hypothetical protein
MKILFTCMNLLKIYKKYMIFLEKPTNIYLDIVELFIQP